ncbi:MAG TPA: tyrosine-type recombinase/integrase [Fimbriimonadaceae bacterium]|jgi:integrase|nr:tyrosine-type recombinase/integrase [Fimbriimonadaceae bacterium]
MAGSKRRARGEGTFERLPSGLWRCIVKQNGKKIAGPARPTKSEARAALNQKLAVPPGGENRSLSSAARLWLTESTHLAPTTRDTYLWWTSALEADPLADLPVLAITERDLAAWVRRQLKRLAPATVRNRLGHIHQVLRYAGNPARTTPPARGARLRRPLSPDERAALDAAIASEPDSGTQMAAMLLRYLGLRVSEACGLMHEDRDGDGVWIRRGVTVTRDAIHVRERLKTARSSGWVPLPMILRPLVGHGSGYVIQLARQRKGEPAHPKTVKCHLKGLLLRAGLGHVPAIGPHTLRRTYGQTLLEAGVDVVTAAQAMRHDPTILMREYAQSRTDLMRDAVRKAFDEPA